MCASAPCAGAWSRRVRVRRPARVTPAEAPVAQAGGIRPSSLDPRTFLRGMTAMRTTTSFFSVNRLMWASAPVLIASLVACGDASTEPTAVIAPQDVALAAELESVAQNARAAGDSERESAFTYAAAAIRLGVRPSTLIVSNDGVEQRFNAYVIATDNRGLTEPDREGRRTLTAWRRTELGMQLIYIGSPAAKAQVTSAPDDAAAWYFDP